MTEATPAASTGSETPAAAVVTPLVSAPADSVFAPTPAAAVTPPAATVVPPITVVTPPGATPPAATPPAATWQYADGVPGQGDAPTYYKSDKYKSVAAQAEAYAHLEKRFGAFTGAPADGKYEFTPPQGVTGEFEAGHPLFVGFNKWAAENQLSGKGYNEVLGLFAQYEASLAPDIGAIKKQIGADADARLTASAQWVNANLGADALKTLHAIGSTPAIVQVLPLLEAAIAKSRSAPAPKPGDDVPNAQPSTVDSIRAEMNQPDPQNPKKRLWDTSPEFRAQMEKKLAAALPAKARVA